MIDLLKATPTELDEFGKRLGLEFHHKLSTPKKVDQIRKAMIKKEEETRNLVRSEAQVAAKEKLGYSKPDLARQRPSWETVAIKASDLVQARFTNRENPATPEEGPGAEVEFDKGAFHFKLYDGHTYCMPEVMVSSNPMSCGKVKEALVQFAMAPWPKQEPMEEAAAEKMAETVMRSMNLCYEDPDHQTRCTGPSHKRVKLDAEMVKENQLVAYDQTEAKGFLRFGFNVTGPAPKGATVGSFVE